jgi:hypothetical protein
LHAIARNFECAEKFASQVIELFSNFVLRGWVMALEGNTTQGITGMKQGMPLIQDTDAEICLGCFLPWLSEGLCCAGEIDEGLKVIRRARASATDHFYDAERLRIEGELRASIDGDEARRPGGDRREPTAAMKSLELRAALALHDSN